MADIELVIPGGRPKEILVLERTGTAALLTVLEDGDVAITTATQVLLPVAGDWAIIQFDTWAGMLRAVIDSRQKEINANSILGASGKAGRVARRTKRRLDA